MIRTASGSACHQPAGRAVTAATVSTAIPATFQPSMTPSGIRPRRSSTVGRVGSRAGSSTATRPR
jgi:hypothetical protein